MYYIPFNVSSSKLSTTFRFPQRNSVGILLLPVRAEEIRVVVSFGTVIRDVSVWNVLITAFSESDARVPSPFQTKYSQTDGTEYHTNCYLQKFQCHVVIFYRP